MNPMKIITIEKLTLNVGAGKDQTKLENGITLIENITGIRPVKTITKKRIPEWGLRPGLPIGCKLTLRGKKAEELLKNLLEAKENKLLKKQFTQDGNISFGISEYIDIGQMKYDPKIGIMGLEVCITLKRPGFRVKRRTHLKRKIPKNHKINAEDAMGFMENKYSVQVGE